MATYSEILSRTIQIRHQLRDIFEAQWREHLDETDAVGVYGDASMPVQIVDGSGAVISELRPVYLYNPNIGKDEYFLIDPELEVPFEYQEFEALPGLAKMLGTRYIENAPAAEVEAKLVEMEELLAAVRLTPYETD